MPRSYYVPFNELTNVPPTLILQSNSFNYLSLPALSDIHVIAKYDVREELSNYQYSTVTKKRNFIDACIEERLKALAGAQPNPGCNDEGHQYFAHQFVSGVSKKKTKDIGYWQRKVRSLSIHPSILYSLYCSAGFIQPEKNAGFTFILNPIPFPFRLKTS